MERSMIMPEVVVVRRMFEKKKRNPLINILFLLKFYSSTMKQNLDQDARFLLTMDSYISFLAVWLRFVNSIVLVHLFFRLRQSKIKRKQNTFILADCLRFFSFVSCKNKKNVRTCFFSLKQKFSFPLYRFEFLFINMYYVIVICLTKKKKRFCLRLI